MLLSIGRKFSNGAKTKVTFVELIPIKEYEDV